MLFIKGLLPALGLPNNSQNDYSVACISTTRPIYLVFGDEYDHPTYVIRKLTEDQDFKAHNVHKYLYQLVDNQVPKPAGLYEFAGNQYDVQHGVKGAPWFQIKSRIRTEDERTRLEDKCWRTLADFHSAIAADSLSKPKELSPHEELLKVYAQYQSTEQIINIELEELVGLAARELSKMPNCTSIPQHGDFCLNNLVIDTAHITVIDFEDFAITTMPLYDQFTLALSLPSCSQEPQLATKVMSLGQIEDSAEVHGIPIKNIRWHFLHHILLRLGPWSIGEKRKQYRLWLQQVLDQFVFEHKNTDSNKQS